MLCWFAFLDCLGYEFNIDARVSIREVFLPLRSQHSHSAVQNNATQSFAHLSKFCITFVFYFSWVLQSSQPKSKTMLMQNCGGEGGGQTNSIMEDEPMANKPALKLDNSTILISSSSCRERSAVSYVRRGGLWPTWSRKKGAKNILYCDNQDKQRVTIHWKRWQGNTLAFHLISCYLNTPSVTRNSF